MFGQAAKCLADEPEVSEEVEVVQLPSEASKVSSNVLEKSSVAPSVPNTEKRITVSHICVIISIVKSMWSVFYSNFSKWNQIHDEIVSLENRFNSSIAIGSARFNCFDRKVVIRTVQVVFSLSLS
jgi:hypothetical protein